SIGICIRPTKRRYQLAERRSKRTFDLEYLRKRLSADLGQCTRQLEVHLRLTCGSQIQICGRRY
ncbi:hypothetical protein HAX54_052809, partial [Datura stramonium]|nr:hypothetical protein [Datura stramonium]